MSKSSATSRKSRPPVTSTVTDADLLKYLSQIQEERSRAQPGELIAATEHSDTWVDQQIKQYNQSCQRKAIKSRQIKRVHYYRKDDGDLLEFLQEKAVFYRRRQAGEYTLHSLAAALKCGQETAEALIEAAMAQGVKITKRVSGVGTFYSLDLKNLTQPRL